MRKILMIALIGMAVLTLSACATLSGISTTLSEHSAGTKIAVQYATLKTIEDSSGIEAADLVASVERVRAKVLSDESIALSRLRDEARTAIDFDGLAPSDRLLLMSLLDIAEASVGDVSGPESPLGEAQRVRVMTLLDWIESAAKLAG